MCFLPDTAQQDAYTISYETALNLKSTMGTVIHARQLERIKSMLAFATSNTSATVTAGGYQLTGRSPLAGDDADFDLGTGSFFAPTIVENVDVGDELWEEEVFGPVLVVKRFKVGTTRDSATRLGINVTNRTKQKGFILPMCANMVLGRGCGQAISREDIGLRRRSMLGLCGLTRIIGMTRALLGESLPPVLCATSLRMSLVCTGAG